MKIRYLILILAALLIGSPAYAAGNFDLTQPYNDVTLTAMGEVIMTADLEPIAATKAANGALMQKIWLDHNKAVNQHFRIDVMVLIPNEALGIYTLDDAMDADVRASINRDGYTVECMLQIEPIRSKSYVAFAVELNSEGDMIKPSRGICDVDLDQDGIQLAMPVLHHGDYIDSSIVAKPMGKLEFLGGYCE